MEITILSFPAMRMCFKILLIEKPHPGEFESLVCLNPFEIFPFVGMGKINKNKRKKNSKKE